MRKMMTLVAAGCLSAPALADNVFQVDIDALSAVASGTFSESFTGTLHVFNNATDGDLNGNAEILDVLVDGNAQGTGGAGVDEFAFDMELTFAAGSISSGSLMVAVDQGGSENTYSASVKATTAGSILEIAPGNFIIGGLTFAGTFSDPAGTFLGVDISPWGDVQPLGGRFAEIAFEPDAAHTDKDTDVDVFVMVPMPGAVGMASLGLLGLAARRRRGLA